MINRISSMALRYIRLISNSCKSDISVCRFLQLNLHVFKYMHGCFGSKHIYYPGRKGASRIYMDGIFNLCPAFSERGNDPFANRIVDPYHAFFYGNKTRYGRTINGYSFRIRIWDTVKWATKSLLAAGHGKFTSA